MTSPKAPNHEILGAQQLQYSVSLHVQYRYIYRYMKKVSFSSRPKGKVSNLWHPSTVLLEHNLSVSFFPHAHPSYHKAHPRFINNYN